MSKVVNPNDNNNNENSKKNRQNSFNKHQWNTYTSKKETSPSNPQFITTENHHGNTRQHRTKNGLSEDMAIDPMVYHQVVPLRLQFLGYTPFSQ